MPNYIILLGMGVLIKLGSFWSTEQRNLLAVFGARLEMIIPANGHDDDYAQALGIWGGTTSVCRMCSSVFISLRQLSSAPASYRVLLQVHSFAHCCCSCLKSH